MDEATVSYRIESLEQKVNEVNGKLDKLTELVTQGRMNDSTTSKDIEHLNERVQSLEEKQSEMQDKVKEIEEAPNKDKAGKWTYITDYIFKILVGACFSGLLLYLAMQLQNLAKAVQ